jgi:hypothetical protein
VQFGGQQPWPKGQTVGLCSNRGAVISAWQLKGVAAQVLRWWLLRRYR